MMTRRHFVARTFLALASGGFGPSLLAKASAHDDALYILHTNDTHSRLKPFPEADSTYGGLGGAARRAHFIRQFRANHRNVLLLDSGDFFQGTPFFNMFAGEPEIRVMTALGYDASTLGNHDFDIKVSGLKNAMKHARFPLIVSNYDAAKSEISSIVKPWTTFQRGPWKIGVFGLGIDFDKLVAAELHENISYLDPIPVARSMVQTLRQKKCDLVICLSHLGYRYQQSDRISDRILAQNVEGIDLILGGHTHTFLDKPEIFTGSPQKETQVAQVGCFGVRVGIIKVTGESDTSPRLTSSYQTIGRKPPESAV